MANLFTAGDLPPGNPNDWAEEADRTFGYTVKFAVSGTVTGARVYGPTTNPPATCRIKLFLKSTQTLLAARTFGTTIAAGAWNSLDFVAPVAVTANTEYVIAYFMNGSGNFCYTTGALTSDKTNGNITAVGGEGRFKTGGAQDDYPGSTGTELFFVDPNFESASGSQTINVGIASEFDSARSVTTVVTTAVSVASEGDSARTVTTNVATGVGLASEVDSARNVQANVVTSVGIASENDSARAVRADQAVDIKQAEEIDAAMAMGGDQNIDVKQAAEADTAISIGSSGGASVASENLSSTYYANQLAGSLVNGTPSLTLKRALAVWLAEADTLEIAGILNTDLGNVLPQWLALVGAMNQKAGTDKTFSFHDALKQLAP